MNASRAKAALDRWYGATTVEQLTHAGQALATIIEHEQGTRAIIEDRIAQFEALLVAPQTQRSTYGILVGRIEELEWVLGVTS